MIVQLQLKSNWWLWGFIMNIHPLTVLFCAQGVLAIFFKIRCGTAPKLPIITSLWGAWVEGLAHWHKWENTRLAIWVATINFRMALYAQEEKKSSPNKNKFSNNFSIFSNTIQEHLVACLRGHVKGWNWPHSLQLTPFPWQVHNICLLPWVLIQRIPTV